MPIEHGLDERAHGLGALHVGLNEGRLLAARADLSSECFSQGRTAGRDHDERAFAREGLRRRTTDAARTAGHDDDAIGESLPHACQSLPARESSAIIEERRDCDNRDAAERIRGR